MGESYIPRVEEIDSLLELGGAALYECFIWRTQLPLTYLKLLSKIDADGKIEARAVLQYPSEIQSVRMIWTGLSEVEFAWLVWRISAWEAEAGRDMSCWIKEASKRCDHPQAAFRNEIYRAGARKEGRLLDDWERN